jgi:alpha-N-arabinofuranosidase
MLSLDEWNVWYKAHSPSDLKQPGWPVAPRLLEEIYNFEDALIIGGSLIAMINNADRVKSACLAQLVNVIGAIYTENGGPAWRQTIFHPFSLAARHARGTVLRTRVSSGTFSTGKLTGLPTVISSVIHDADSGTTTVLVMNRSTSEEADATIDLRGGSGDQAIELALELKHDNLKAVNSKDAPDEVAPRELENVTIEGGTIRAVLKPLSWNILVTKDA